MSDRRDDSSLAARSRLPESTRSRLDPVRITLVALAATCLVVLFFGWNALCLPLGGRLICRAGFGVVSGWADFGVVAGVAGICLILWEVLSVADALVLPDPAAGPLVAAGLGAAMALFALLRVLTHLRGLTGFGWLGLALAGATCAVAVARWLIRLGVSQRAFVASRR